MNKISLSLAGGGAKAICYLGFIRALEKKGIEIDHIFTFSGASLLMCYMASGMNDKEIIKEFSKFRFRNFINLLTIKESFYSSKKIESFLNKLTKQADIKDLPYKTSISVSDVTNFKNPKKVIFNEGNLANITVKSMSIPPMFPLYEEDGRLYADGVFTARFNAKEMREAGADYILGIYPDPVTPTDFVGPFNTLAYLVQALVELKYKYDKDDLAIDMEMEDFDIEIPLNGFKMAHKGYEVGYLKGLEVADKLLKT